MKNLFIYTAAALVVVLASINIYQAFAQSDLGRFAGIYEGTEPGDEDIVARIGEQTVKQQQFRQAVDYLLAIEDPDPTADDAAVEEMKAVAKDTAVVLLIHDTIEYAEAVSLGFSATDAEVEAFMEPIKELCAGPDGRDCQQLMRELDLTPEEYWEMAFVEYQRYLTTSKMKAAHVTDLYPDGFTYEQRNDAMESFEVQLHENATIQWEDETWREIYENATSGSTGNVND